MSEPMASTGLWRPVVCACGAHTNEIALRGMYGSSRWMIAKHDAPCGLPCISGGVPGKAYRDGQYHPSKTPCPHCPRPL